MNQISGLKELHESGSGSPKIIIAILDGPVELKHLCFNEVEGNLVPLGLPMMRLPPLLNGIEAWSGNCQPDFWKGRKRSGYG